MSIGTPELILCAVIGLLVLGPERLPEVARTVGKIFHEFRKISNDVTGQVRAFIDEEPPPAAPGDGRDYTKPSPNPAPSGSRPANAPPAPGVQAEALSEASQPANAAAQPPPADEPSSPEQNVPPVRRPPDVSQFAVIPDPRNYSPRTSPSQHSDPADDTAKDPEPAGEHGRSGPGDQPKDPDV